MSNKISISNADKNIIVITINEMSIPCSIKSNTVNELMDELFMSLKHNAPLNITYENNEKLYSIISDTQSTTILVDGESTNLPVSIKEFGKEIVSFAKQNSESWTYNTQEEVDVFDIDDSDDVYEENYEAKVTQETETLSNHEIYWELIKALEKELA